MAGQDMESGWVWRVEKARGQGTCVRACGRAVISRNEEWVEEKAIYNKSGRSVGRRVVVTVVSSFSAHLSQSPRPLLLPMIDDCACLLCHLEAHDAVVRDHEDLVAAHAKRLTWNVWVRVHVACRRRVAI